MSGTVSSGDGPASDSPEAALGSTDAPGTETGRETTSDPACVRRRTPGAGAGTAAGASAAAVGICVPTAAGSATLASTGVAVAVSLAGCGAAMGWAPVVDAASPDAGAAVGDTAVVAGFSTAASASDGAVVAGRGGRNVSGST